MHKTLPVMIFALLVVGLVAMGLNKWLQPSYDTQEAQSVAVSGVVVPHHNIVAGQRAIFFRDLAKKIGETNLPQTVILVSPNHYLAGHGKIQTTDKDWRLNKGSVLANKSVVKKLVESQAATIETSSFAEEHGIYNILGDIHKTFPKANIVPIILEDASQEQLNKLEQTLLESCSKCLMISSVDFSHYQPAALAELHDQKTIRDLQNLDTIDIAKNVEVDSGASLALLTMWARHHQTMRFNLQKHTNSDLLLGNPDLEGTSHVFGWYEQGAKIVTEKFISFVISNNLHVGEEDRSIWGTDVVINKSGKEFLEPYLPANSFKKVPDDLILAGKLTPQGIEIFGLPVSKSKESSLIKIATGPAKTDVLSLIYSPYKKYLNNSPAGQYINIPTSTNTSFDDLSPSTIESKIKLLINIK